MRKLLLGLTMAMVTMAGALPVATPASAQVYCDPGWIQTGTASIDVWSPWFTSTDGPLGNKREISFHVLSGVQARYQYQNCSLGPVHYFFTASWYRWRAWGEPPGPFPIGYHNRNWRWPDQCAGFDEKAGWWVHWSC